MGLICYMAEHHPAYTQFQEVVEALRSETAVEMYTSFSSLSKRFSRPFRHSNIFVLVAADRKELQKILSLRVYLLDMPVVLILPDGEKDTFKQGHSLYPRFISYLENNFDDVTAVLEKMIQRYAA